MPTGEMVIEPYHREVALTDERLEAILAALTRCRLRLTAVHGGYRVHLARILNRESYRGTVSYTADPRIDAYIDALPAWQQAICRQVRDLVHAADPEVTETIKRTRQPYFVLEGNICALLAGGHHHGRS